jgi:sulfatase modifying factor 1
MFNEENPARKLAAALALASSRRDCARYGYARLLEATPQDVAPLVRCLQGRMTDLVQDLDNEINHNINSTTYPVNQDLVDRRRANAAVALVMLGRHDSGFRLLKFDPRPQARSFMIHGLGQAGVHPRVVHNALIGGDAEPSVRRALIQAIGEMPASAWDPDERQKVASALLELFRNHPDAGIHASARWLLAEWGFRSKVREIDEELVMAQGYRKDFRWRVGRCGLTFVRVDDPETGREFEVSDTEVPRDVFLRFVRDHRFRPEASPAADCPITGINYQIASVFCNALTDFDGLGKDQRCYGAASRWNVDPVDGVIDRAGYRLLTDREFRIACQSGTTTSRYYGDSTELLARYAWYDRGARMQTHPVGRLKPNDFGLFDVLGNVGELCHVADAPADSLYRAVYCGGSVKNPDFDIRYDGKKGPTVVYQKDGLLDYGLRVARTLRTACVID